MKAIAYHITAQQKESLIVANHKKHDITIIGAQLNLHTLDFASGKEALILFNNDMLNAELILRIAELGIKYIVTASEDTSHIDLETVRKCGLKIANLSKDSELNSMIQLISHLDNWAEGLCIGKACCCSSDCKPTTSLS